MGTIIYHNPACGTSRNTLALIRAAGIEPVIIEYLKAPPSRDTIRDLARAMGQPLRALIREKGTPYADLGLSDPGLGDDRLLDALAAHPVLLNRPVVVTPLGARICRPAETVLALLPPTPPAADKGSFADEDNG